MPLEEHRISRRRFIASTLLATAAAQALAHESETLPFENGERPLVKYPQKRALLRLTARPPQLETPFSVFNEGVITPNDAFFVRYHLTLSPPGAEQLAPERFRLRVRGAVNSELRFSMAELKQ